MLRELDFVARNTRGLCTAAPSRSPPSGAPSLDPNERAAERELQARRARAVKERAMLSFAAYVLRVCTAVMSLAGLFLAIWAAEVIFTARVEEPFTNPLGRCALADSLKTASSVLTAVVAALFSACWVCEWRLRLSVGLALQGQTLQEALFFSWEGRLALLQLAALLVHCPAGVYAVWRTRNVSAVIIPYDADSLLTMVMFLPRAWPTVELLLRFFAGFDSVRAGVVQARTGIQLNTPFSVRFLLARYPLLSATIFFFSLVGVFSYWMKVRCTRERPPQPQRKTQPHSSPKLDQTGERAAALLYGVDGQG